MASNAALHWLDGRGWLVFAGGVQGDDVIRARALGIAQDRAAEVGRCVTDQCQVAGADEHLELIPTGHQLGRVPGPGGDLDQLRFAASTADQSRGREALQKVDQLLAEVEQRCAP